MIRAVYNYGSLKDRYKGKPALVLGRGHSRLEITPERMDKFKEAGGVIFICNQLLLVPEVAQRADWLVFLDNIIILNNFDEIKAWDKPIFTLPQHASISKSMGPVSCPISMIRSPYYSPDDGTFYKSNSTPHVSVQLAAWMGCPEIYVAGVDLRPTPNGNSHADKFGTWNGENVDKALTRMLLQFHCYATMRMYVDEHPTTARVYKTSDWSLLPLETKEFGY